MGNYPDEISAREEIGRYIERYHHSRPHQSLMNFTPAHVHEVNNKSRLLAELKEMKRRTREKRKAYWVAKPKSGFNLRLRGDVQVRVRTVALILGQIRRLFFNINSRILKTRVPQPKTTHLMNPILSH